MDGRIVVMQRGIIQQVGAPTQLYEQPNNTLVASFIGRPAMNFLNGRAKDEGIALSDEDATIHIKDATRRHSTHWLAQNCGSEFALSTFLSERAGDGASLSIPR